MTSDSVGPATTRQIRGSSLLLAGRLLAMAVNTGTQVMIVRALTKDDYGAFAYGLSLLTFARVAVGLGHNQATSRFLAMYDERQDYRRLRGTLWMITIVAVATTGALLGLAFLTRDGLLLDLLHDPETVSLVLILLLLAPIEVIDDALESAFAVFSRPRSIFLRKHVLGPLLALLVVVAVVLSDVSVHALAVGYVGAGAAGMAFYALSLRGVLRRALPASAWATRPRLPFGPFYRFSVPLLTTELLHLSLTTLSVVLVGAYGSAVEVAEFRAIRPVAVLNQVAYTTFALLFAPLVSRHHERNEAGAIGAAYWPVAAWLAVASFPVFVLTGPFADSLTTLMFGDRYGTSAPYLALLSIGYYANCALGFNALVLRITGHVGLTVGISSAVAALSALLLVGLVPVFGALGASVAILVSLVLVNAANQVAVARRTEVPLFAPGFRRLYATLVIAAIALWATERALDPAPVVGVVIAVAASGAVFLATRRALDIAAAFPELLSVPVLGRLIAGRPDGAR